MYHVCLISCPSRPYGWESAGAPAYAGPGRHAISGRHGGGAGTVRVGRDGRDGRDEVLGQLRVRLAERAQHVPDTGGHRLPRAFRVVARPTARPQG